MELKEVEELRILDDFKMFIREIKFYDFSDNLLFDFACSMDNIYFPLERKYYEVLLKVIEQRELLFSSFSRDLNDNHLNEIKDYIKRYIDKYHLTCLSKDSIKKYDTVLFDFKNCIEQKKIIYLSDFYYFAYYMNSFYPNYPFYEVTNLLCSLNKSNNNIVNVDFYLKFLNSECINLQNVSFGHCFEIMNFTREKNILNNKVMVKV